MGRMRPSEVPAKTMMLRSSPALSRRGGVLPARPSRRGREKKHVGVYLAHPGRGRLPVDLGRCAHRETRELNDRRARVTMGSYFESGSVRGMGQVPGLPIRITTAPLRSRQPAGSKKERASQAPSPLSCRPLTGEVGGWFESLRCSAAWSTSMSRTRSCHKCTNGTPVLLAPRVSNAQIGIDCAWL